MHKLMVINLNFKITGVCLSLYSKDPISVHMKCPIVVLSLENETSCQVKSERLGVVVGCVWQAEVNVLAC